jgi:hypothetical protein
MCCKHFKFRLISLIEFDFILSLINHLNGTVEFNKKSMTLFIDFLFHKAEKEIVRFFSVLFAHGGYGSPRQANNISIVAPKSRG